MAAVATEDGGAGGDNKVEVPNEVTGGRGARNRRRAVGGEAVAVDGDNVDPSPLLRRHRRRCTTTFSAHRCAAIAAPPRRRQETMTMETTTKATLMATEMTTTVTMATTTRPQRRDNDDETMISRYNNQLNGGPSAVER